MKYVVTGGAGFIGSTLTDRLVEEGNEVIVIDDLSTGFEHNINPSAEFIKHDIRFGGHGPHSWASILKGTHTIFHCAALARVQPSIEDPLLYNDVNVNGTLNLLEACRVHGVHIYTNMVAGRWWSGLR